MPFNALSLRTPVEDGKRDSVGRLGGSASGSWPLSSSRHGVGFPDLRPKTARQTSELYHAKPLIFLRFSPAVA